MDPLLGAGIGLQLGGMLANMGASGQVDAARGAALSAENARQNAWNNQIFDLAGKSRGRYADFSGQMADKTADLSKFYNAQGTTLPPSGPTAGTIPASTSALVRADGDRQMAKVKAYTDQQHGALANLRSFGDVLGTAARGVQDDEGNINIVNSYKKGSAGVLPLELQQANTAGNGLKMLGDVAGGLGRLGVAGGLAGGGSAIGSGLFGTGAPIAGVIGPQQLGMFPRIFGYGG